MKSALPEPREPPRPSGNPTIQAKLKTGTSGSLVDCQTGAVTNAIKLTTNYGFKGLVTASLDARGVATTFQYDANNLYLTTRNEACNTTGQAGGSCDIPVARRWSYETDFYNGRVTRVTDLDNGTSISTTYDVFGRPKVVTEPYPTTVTDYGDPQRYRLVQTTLDGSRSLDTVENYDQLGRTVWTRRSDSGPLSPTDTSSGIGVETRYQYTTAGRYEFSSNPYKAGTAASLRGWTRRKYDVVGRLVEEATFDGAAFPGSGETGLNGKTTISYNSNQRTIRDQAANSSVSGNPGSVRTITEDAAGRITQVADGAGATLYSYDALSNLRIVEQGEQRREFVYDALGRLTSASNPESGTIQYRYDDNGNLVEKGRFMSPDLFNPLALKRDKLDAWISDPQHWNKYAYVLNNPIKYVDPSGLTETIYYFLNSNLTEEQKKYFQEHKAEILEGIGNILKAAGVKDVAFKEGNTLTKSQITSMLSSEPKGVAFLNFANKSYAGYNAPQGNFGATGGLRSAVFVGNLQTDSPKASELAFRISEVSSHELGHRMGFYSRGATLSFVMFWNKDLMNEGQGMPSSSSPRFFDTSIPENRQIIDEINKLPEYKPPQ
jgi:RHS repeat-associated protein